MLISQKGMVRLGSVKIGIFMGIFLGIFLGIFIVIFIGIFSEF